MYRWVHTLFHFHLYRLSFTLDLTSFANITRFFSLNFDTIKSVEYYHEHRRKINWRGALSPRRWTATFTCALAERTRFHFRVHFAGSVDKDCHEREGHEAYEVHSASQAGLVGAGGGRVALSHGEALLGAHAHSTTPHLTGPAPPSPQYRPLPPDHEPPQHYGAPSAEPRPSVIESSQPLIIECTWVSLHTLIGRVFTRRIMWFPACDLEEYSWKRTITGRALPVVFLVSTSGYEITIWTLSCTFVKYYIV